MKLVLGGTLLTLPADSAGFTFSMHTTRVALGRAVLVTFCLPVAVSDGAAQDSANACLTYTTFTVPGASSLAAESINDIGTLSGYYTDAGGNTLGYLLTTSGTVIPYSDPANTTSPGFTVGGQINKSGFVAGEFYDTAAATYEGFIYKSSAGTFTTYASTTGTAPGVSTPVGAR